MLKKLAIALTAITFTLALTGCGGEKKTAEAKDVKPAATAAVVNSFKPEVNHKPLRFLTEDKNAPVVYFTKDISAGGLMKVYKALGQEKKGKVAVKVSFGAEGEQYLDPILMAELMKETQGTFVDTNGFTAPRNTAKGNYAMAEKHGFTKVGPVDVLDADGDIDMPVQNGYHLKYTRTGSHIQNYDTFVACLKKNTNFYNIVITYLRQNVQCLFCSTAITKKHSNVKGHSVVFYEMFLIHGNHTVMTFPYIYLFCKLQHVDAVVFFPRSSCGIILGRAEFKIHTGLV